MKKDYCVKEFPKIPLFLEKEGKIFWNEEELEVIMYISRGNNQKKQMQNSKYKNKKKISTLW